MKKIFIVLIVLVIGITAIGCNTPEVIGYTYDLDNDKKPVRLSDITLFSYEIESESINGKIVIGNEETTFEGTKIETDSEYVLFNGHLYLGQEKYKFDLFLYNSQAVTGLFYNESRTLVNGFIIEKLSGDK